MGLGQVGAIKTEYFSQTGTPSRDYFKAMNLVFDHANIFMYDVRIALATEAMYGIIRPALASSDGNSDAIKQQIIGNTASHLNDGMAPSPVPMWAVTVYATFLWGWLNDFIAIDDDVNGRYNRRIFLAEGEGRNETFTLVIKVFLE